MVKRIRYFSCSEYLVKKSVHVNVYIYVYIKYIKVVSKNFKNK